MSVPLPPDVLARMQARQSPPEAEPRQVPWGMIIFVLSLLGAVAWFGYPLWKYRLPQERDLTDQGGKTLHVRLEAKNDTLLKYTLPGSDTAHFLPIASLAPADKEFVGHLKSGMELRFPWNYDLTDSAGKTTPIRLVAHNKDWVQYTILTDGTTHYLSLASLPPSDQMAVSQFPANLNLNYPVDYVFTGAPEPGAKIRLLGHNDDSFKYLELADGKTYTASIDSLSKADQRFVRLLWNNLPPDRVADDPSPPPPSSPDAPKTNDGPLPDDQIKALVFIEGDQKSGTGFIAKLYGQYFVVTNQHVLSGNKKFTVTGPNGIKFPTNGTLFGAVNYDVAILKIPDNLAKFYLDVMDDPHNNAKVDDLVTVPSNALGARVPTQINGRLLAIGPELVEVDAEFKPGNSGSPIIDRPSGKVIGIATMTITYNLDALSRNVLNDETRWFGYRLDNIDPKTGWQILDWARFSADGVNVSQVDDLYKGLISLLGRKNTMESENLSIHNAIQAFQLSINDAVDRNNRVDYVQAIQDFNTKLRSLTDSSIRELSDHPLYAYHAKIVKEQQEIQKYLDQVFRDTSVEIANVAHKGLPAAPAYRGGTSVSRGG